MSETRWGKLFEREYNFTRYWEVPKPWHSAFVLDNFQTFQYWSLYYKIVFFWQISQNQWLCLSVSPWHDLFLFLAFRDIPVLPISLIWFGSFLIGLAMSVRNKNWNSVNLRIDRSIQENLFLYFAFQFVIKENILHWIPFYVFQFITHLAWTI